MPVDRPRWTSPASLWCAELEARAINDAGDLVMRFAAEFEKGRVTAADLMARQHLRAVARAIWYQVKPPLDTVPLRG